MTDSLIATLWLQRYCLTSIMHFVFNVIQKRAINTLSVNNYTTRCRCFAMPLISWKPKTSKVKSSLFPCKMPWWCEPWTVFNPANTTVKRCLLTIKGKPKPIYKSPECINKLYWPCPAPSGLPSTPSMAQKPHFSPDPGCQSLLQWCHHLTGLQWNFFFF